MKPEKKSKTLVRQAKARGIYDKTSICEILDVGIVGHIGFIQEDEPFVVPMLYWRIDDDIYWHAAIASRLAKMTSGRDVCFSVTLLDGLVLAKSAFNHSANYRSVTVFGQSELITSSTEIEQHFEYFTEKLYPGRWAHIRPLTKKELNATALIRLPIDEASAKVRTGPPKFTKADAPYENVVWSGEIPITMVTGDPVADATSPGNIHTPNIGQPFSLLPEEKQSPEIKTSDRVFGAIF